MRRVQVWEQYQSGDDGDEDNWTPPAQSKSRLFWQVPIPNGKRNGGSSDNSIHKQRSFKDWTSSKIGQKFLNRVFGCIKVLRYMIEKTTVYVLECEHGKYYVGSTVNVKRRLKQHFDSSRSGSVWTKKHKPIRVLQIYRRVPYRYKLGFEAQVTAELMWDKGINNVRGAMYLYAREYSAQDLDSLVSFIGHYNDLSFKYVRSRLIKELQGYESRPVDNARTRRKENRKHLQKEYMRKIQSKKEESIQLMKDNTSRSSTTTSSTTKGLASTNKLLSKQQKDARNRYEGGATNDLEDNENHNEQYKVMDDWLNRNISFDENSIENISDEEPETIDDL